MDLGNSWTLEIDPWTLEIAGPEKMHWTLKIRLVLRNFLDLENCPGPTKFAWTLEICMQFFTLTFNLLRLVLENCARNIWTINFLCFTFAKQSRYSFTLNLKKTMSNLTEVHSGQEFRSKIENQLRRTGKITFTAWCPFADGENVHLFTFGSIDTAMEVYYHWAGIKVISA